MKFTVKIWHEPVTEERYVETEEEARTGRICVIGLIITIITFMTIMKILVSIH